MDDGSRNTDHSLIVTPTARPPVDWSRYLSGFGTLVVAAAAFFGLLGGLTSQIVLFGEYEQRVEAKLYEPLILPCLVALVAAVAAAVTWRSAFVKGRAPRSRIVLYLAMALGSLLVAAVLIGPTERELEAGWTEKLERLQLPAEFTPVPVDPALRSDRYAVSRHWATERKPEQVCDVVQLALESWLGSVSVDRVGSDGCYLSAVDGNDFVSTSFASPGVDAPGPEILEVRISYAL